MNTTRLVYSFHTRAFVVAAAAVKSIFIAALGFTILFYGPAMLDYLAAHPLQTSAPRTTTMRPIVVLVLMGDEAAPSPKTSPANPPNKTAAARGSRITLTAKGTDSVDGTYTTNYEVGEAEREMARGFIANGGWKHYAPWETAKANRHLVVISIAGVDNEFDGYFARDQKLSDEEKELARMIAALIGEMDGWHDGEE